MHCGAMETTQAKDHGGGNVGAVGGGYRDVTSPAIGGIGSGDGGLSEISCGEIAGFGDLGGTSHNGPMGSEPPCPMANTTQGRIDDNHEVQTITEAMINKILFTCSETIGQKRTFLDIDLGIHFVDIEKDFQPISDQFNGSGSDDDCFMTLTDLAGRVITGYGGKGSEGDGRVGDGYGIPKFLHKLYNMVAKEEINDLIAWNLPYCDSFIIWDINKFATHVLPMYFKHANFSSFNSQLNVYVSVGKGRCNVLT
ncbi:hypothetical protein L1987_03436 [Smallanthus sonchifolius]|uniref:Uncharacterized protein n=1 Tax=Smallanthus sonchifolius TaxID=185202 RepID=A0ACB9KAP8_9ASTR|nr:hypothetical protein L1987_03436 [Smallanthus sonchifolius]